MSSAITKTLSLLLLLGIGFLLQRKLQSKEHKEGIRTLILSLALPATIFIALLQIEFKSGLIMIPVLSLGFNLVMHFMMDKLPLRSLVDMPVNRYRTLIMLIPSLAPGLSCFPFIVEYSGQGPLAMAALADVGNKIFVLIISYTIAMKWYYEVNHQKSVDSRTKLKELGLALLNEPVNLVIVAALVMLIAGMNYQSLPEMVTLSIDRLSLMMTPLILIFIGLSIRLTWDQVKSIFTFLTFRSGVAFLLSGLVLLLFPVRDAGTALLIVVFPQSACSFWPFAHMSAVTTLERKSKEEGPRTFDQEYAMNVLACSMPLSVILILGIYSSGDFFAKAPAVLGVAVMMILLASVIVLAGSKYINALKGNALGLADELKEAEAVTR